MVKGALAFFLFAVLAQAAVYRVEHSFPQTTPKVGQKTILQFSLFRANNKTPLTSADLDLEHEKLIHLMSIDSGFQNYLHEHPVEVSPGVWQLPLTLNIAGNYRFFLQFRPTGELLTKTLFMDALFLEMPGQEVPSSPVHPEENLVSTSGDFKVTLLYAADPPMQKKITPVFFRVEKKGVSIGSDDLDDYLGAKMHLAVISADKTDFVHAHPESGVSKLYLKQSGYYGLFMQFSYQGVLVTNQFSLHVKPSIQDR